MRKSTVCNLLGAKYGYRSYLEISREGTGQQHDLIDRNQFTLCEQLVYPFPFDQPGVVDIDGRMPPTTSSGLVRALVASRRQYYDLVFVDPHHTYENSYEDLVGALELVRPGGMIVVHDCNPRDPSIVLRQFRKGGWCGVTYWAFIDFVLGRTNIRYYTVDSDYGCGVVYKLPHAHAPAPVEPTPATLELEWTYAKWSDDTRYQFFDRNRTALLNLLSIDEFISAEGLVVPPATVPGAQTSATSAAGA